MGGCGLGLPLALVFIFLFFFRFVIHYGTFASLTFLQRTQFLIHFCAIHSNCTQPAARPNRTPAASKRDARQKQQDAEAEGTRLLFNAEDSVDLPIPGGAGVPEAWV